MRSFLSYILRILFRFLNDAALIIQKNFRGYLTRKSYRARIKVYTYTCKINVNIEYYMDTLLFNYMAYGVYLYKYCLS